MIFFDGLIYRLRPCGGISRIFRELWNRWEKVEQDAVAFVPKGIMFPSKERPSWRHFSGLRPGRFFWPIEMRNAFKKARPDLFISTYYTGAPDNRTPEILFVYDMIYERFMNQTWQDRSFIRKKRELIQRAAKIIAISESTAQDILYFCSIPEQRIQVIYPAASDHFKPGNPGEKEQNPLLTYPYILYVGRRDHYKNFSILLDVYVNSAGIHQNFHLVVIDRKPWQQDELAKIVSSGLRDRIHLTNNVSDQELPRYYQQARVFVFPSKYEGFGIPLLESLSCGTPVIANRTSSLVEIGSDAILYFSEPDGHSSLLQQLEKVCFDDQLHGSLASRAIGRAAAFSWERFALKFKEVIHSL